MVELYGKCHKNNEKKVQSVFVDMIGMKEKLYSPDSIVIVYPPAPPQEVLVTFPSKIATNFVPSGAAMSMPL